MQTHSILQLDRLQGNDGSILNVADKEERMNLHVTLQSFLVVTSMLSGMLCGVTSVAMKLALEIVTLAPHYVTNYMLYAMIMTLALTSLLNFLNLTTTLMLYSQLYTMPPYESAVIFGNLLAGGFIMNEFQDYSYMAIFILFIGSAIAVFGILYKVRFIDEESIEQ